MSKFAVSGREKDRDERLGHRTQTKADRGLLYWHFFLTTLWVYIKGFTSLLLWRFFSQPGTACTPHLDPHWLLSESDWLDCPSGWLSLFRPSSNTIPFWCSLPYTARTSSLEIPIWRVSKRSISNISSITTQTFCLSLYLLTKEYYK